MATSTAVRYHLYHTPRNGISAVFRQGRIIAIYLLVNSGTRYLY